MSMRLSAAASCDDVVDDDDESLVTVAGIDIGTKNLSWCILSIGGSARTTIHSWTKTAIYSGDTNPRTDELLKSAVDVFRQLDAEFARCEHVYIESQSYAQEVMREVAAAILAHFYTTRSQRPVSFVHGGTKYRLATTDEKVAAERGPRGGKSTTYEANKRLSVILCERLIRETCDRVQEALDVLMAAEKRDDFADSFLLAYAHAHPTHVKLSRKLATVDKRQRKIVF